jgi:hypothetical protein
MTKTKLMPIVASQEWLEFAHETIQEAIRNAAVKVFEEFQSETPLPMFFHLVLCRAMHDIYACAPNKKEAERFINQAFDEVKENWRKK